MKLCVVDLATDEIEILPVILCTVCDTEDTVQDNSLDFEHIGASSRTNFDNNFIGFILSTVLKRSSMKGGVPPGQVDILVDTAQNGIGILYNNFKTERLENDYNRLDIEPSKSSSS